MDKNRWSLVCLNLYNLFRQWWLLFSITNNFLSLPWTNWWKEVHLQSLAKNIPLMKAAASQNITLIVWSLIFIFNLSNDNINKAFHYKVLLWLSSLQKWFTYWFLPIYIRIISISVSFRTAVTTSFIKKKITDPRAFIIALVMLNNELIMYLQFTRQVK